MNFNRTKYTNFTVFFLLICALIGMLLTGCNNRAGSINADNSKLVNSGNQEMDTKSQSESYVNIDEFPEYSVEHTRLEYTVFQDILADKVQFYEISIIFGDAEYSPGGESIKVRMLDLNTGTAYVPQYFSSVEPYKVNYDIVDSTDPFDPGEEYTGELQPEDLEDLFEYIGREDNRSYFFNGEEYNVLQQPYLSPGMFINNADADFIFTLAFGEMTDLIKYRTISKSTNDPDAIWQGLIEIIEDNIIVKVSATE